MEYKKTNPEEQNQMVEEPSVDYHITIPVIVPTMGGYTLEELTNKLTEFANQLVMNHNKSKGWRAMTISDKVKKMSLGESDLSSDLHSDKELLTEILNEKYQ